MLREAIRIFVVDDDELYSAKLGYYLSLNPEYQVKKFYSAKSLAASLPCKGIGVYSVSSHLIACFLNFIISSLLPSYGRSNDNLS